MPYQSTLPSSRGPSAGAVRSVDKSLREMTIGVRTPGRPSGAILDDYQNAAFAVACWSALNGRVALRHFGARLGDKDTVVRALAGIPIVIAMRERTLPSDSAARMTALRMVSDLSGRPIVDAQQELTITVADPVMSAELSVPLGATMARMVRLAVDSGGVRMLVAGGLYRAMPRGCA